MDLMFWAPLFAFVVFYIFCGFGVLVILLELRSEITVNGAQLLLWPVMLFLIGITGKSDSIGM